jgi:hypothetical protein
MSDKPQTLTEILLDYRDKIIECGLEDGDCVCQEHAFQAKIKIEEMVLSWVGEDIKYHTVNCAVNETNRGTTTVNPKCNCGKEGYNIAKQEIRNRVKEIK